QGGEKQAFTAEERRFDIADVFNIEIHAGLKRYQTARIDPEQFTGCERSFDQHSARVHERPTVALKTLHDEAFSTEKPNAQSFLNWTADAAPLGARKKGIFLSDQFPAGLGQPDGHDFSGRRRSKRHPFFALAGI